MSTSVTQRKGVIPKSMRVRRWTIYVWMEYMNLATELTTNIFPAVEGELSYSGHWKQQLNLGMWHGI